METSTSIQKLYNKKTEKFFISYFGLLSMAIWQSRDIKQQQQILIDIQNQAVMNKHYIYVHV